MNARPIRVLVTVFVWFGLGLTTGTAESDSADAVVDARQETRRLLRQAVDNIEAGQAAIALAFLDSVAAIDVTNADSFYYRGLALLDSGDTVNACLALEQGIELAPLSARMKILLARLEIIEGDLDAARDNLEAVLAIKPHEGEALYLNGLIYLKQSDTARAVDFFEEALQQALPDRGK